MWDPAIGEGAGGTAQALEPNYLASNLGSKLIGWVTGKLLSVTLGRATAWTACVVLQRALKIAPAYSTPAVIEAPISKLKPQLYAWNMRISLERPGGQQLLWDRAVGVLLCPRRPFHCMGSIFILQAGRSNSGHKFVNGLSIQHFGRLGNTALCFLNKIAFLCLQL